MNHTESRVILPLGTIADENAKRRRPGLWHKQYGCEVYPNTRIAETQATRASRRTHPSSTAYRRTRSLSPCKSLRKPISQQQPNQTLSCKHGITNRQLTDRFIKTSLPRIQQALVNCHLKMYGMYINTLNVYHSQTGPCCHVQHPASVQVYII